jgi:hypothetical protein
MEAIYSSETSVDFQQTTWRYMPEHKQSCESLKSFLYGIAKHGLQYHAHASVYPI